MKLKDLFNPIKKGLRLFSGADDKAVTPSLPFLPSWFFTANLGIPRGVNIVEIRKYAKSCWFQMVTNAICKQIMTTKWDIVNMDDEDETDYSEDIEKVKLLLNNPNRNGDNFWDIWVPSLRDVLEIDAGVIFKGRNISGELVELFTYDSSTFLKSVDQFGLLLKYYQYSFRYVSSAPREFKKEDIIYQMMNKSNEKFPYGFSPLQSIQQELELMIQSTRHNKEMYRNSTIPDGVVNMDADEEEMLRFQSDWEEKIKGQAHKLMFTNAKDMNFLNLRTSNRDMEWLDGQKWYFHLIFGAYGLSPQEVGFYENSNRSTGESQERITIKNAIKPYLTLISNSINRDIIPDLLKHNEIKFQWILKDSAQERIEHEQIMSKLNSNVYTINEVRAMEGKDPVPWGEEPMKTPNPFNQPFVDMPENNDRDDKKDSDKEKDKKEEERDKGEKKSTSDLYTKLFGTFMKDGKL